MSLVDNKKFIQRFVDETINNKNLDAIDELLAEGFVGHVPFPGEGLRREGLKCAPATLVSAFPEFDCQQSGSANAIN